MSSDNFIDSNIFNNIFTSLDSKTNFTVDFNSWSTSGTSRDICISECKTDEITEVNNGVSWVSY